MGIVSLDASQGRVYSLFKQAETHYNIVYLAATSIHNIYSLAKEKYSFSPQAHTLAKVISYIGLVDFVFAVPRFIENTKQVLYNRSIRPIILTISEGCNIVHLVSECVMLLRKKAFWGYRVFSILYIPNQVVEFVNSLQVAMATRTCKDIATCVTNGAYTLSSVALVVIETTPLVLALYTGVTLASLAVSVV